MKLNLDYIKRKYKRIVKSIAFFPVIISVLYILFSFIILGLDKNNLLEGFKNKIEFLLITDVDTVRTLVSALIGGVLSLTVFSFSMVMIVLSQASSNFSPRLLPGLVSNKRHQIILGVFIGTLLYNIIILLYVKSSADTKSSVGLAVLMAAIFGVLCVAFFVYFIDSISQSIQIQNIIQKIQRHANDSIDYLVENQQNIDQKKVNEFAGKDVLKADSNGYFQGVKKQTFIKSFGDKNITIKVVPSLNQFIWKNEIIAEIDKELGAAEKVQLLESLDITRNRHLRGGYFAELVKLNEIIVKAMSPGINDPGTAIDALNSLGAIMQKLTYVDPYSLIRYNDCNSKLILVQLDIDILLKVIFKQIRHYAKHDAVVMEKLVDIFNLLIEEDAPNKIYLEAFRNTIIKIKKDIKSGIENKMDQKEISKLLGY